MSRMRCLTASDLDWIVEHGGMALLNTHLDNMNFDGSKLGIDEYPAGNYRELLEYVKSKYEGEFWYVLPKDMANLGQIISRSIKEA